MNLETLKYPIGTYVPNKTPSTALLEKWMTEIEEFPVKLKTLTKNCSVKQLNWKYRPNGWCVKQVIHHCTDSHMNSVIRFKLALTEEMPIIRPYFEDQWVVLTDSLDDNIEASIQILTGLHKKWALLLRSLTKEQLDLEYIHPEHGKKFNLAETIGSYAWHCHHHFTHIKNGIESEGKYN